MVDIESYMKACFLCARKCGINRMKRAGRCGETYEVRAVRAALHMWEEPCISGRSGSGTVFFEGCSLGCVYCQNREISIGLPPHQWGQTVQAQARRDVPERSEGLSPLSLSGVKGTGLSTHQRGQTVQARPRRGAPGRSEGLSPLSKSGIDGEPLPALRHDDRTGLPDFHVTEERLARIAIGLEKSGANNINFVTPTHFIPQIINTVGYARELGLSVPVVYNTSSVETPESIDLLDGTADVFLPDLKYMDAEAASRYSDMPDYFKVASAAIERMVRISGGPCFKDTEEGQLMVRGTIVRHLVLPGRTEDSKRILKYLHEEYGSEIYISIMNQYTPMPGIGLRYPELNRRITKREYEKVVDYALSIGIEQAFIQEGKTAEESFIPAFDGEGIFAPPDAGGETYSKRN